MASEHEEVVRSFLADFAGEHLDSDRVERLLTYMAPDARYHVFAWWDPCIGHDAIRAELLKEGTGTSDCSFELLNFASVGRTVFVERLDWFTLNDKHVNIHVVGVFEIDSKGKISSWRDYYDGGEIRDKVGRFTPVTTAGPGTTPNG
jgi:limonene-1,2-epoxide hydrolase